MNFLRNVITTGMIIGLFEVKLLNCERQRHLLFHRHSATPYPLTPSFLRTAAQAGTPQIMGVRCATNDSCNIVATSVDIEPNCVYAFKEKATYVFDDRNQSRSKPVSGSVTVGSYFEFKVRPLGAKHFMIKLYNAATRDEMLRITSYGVLLKTGLISVIGGTIQFGFEEYATTHAFTQETFYVVRCTVNVLTIQVDVNGSPYHTYLQRLPYIYSQITSVEFEAVDGESELEVLEIYLPEF